MAWVNDLTEGKIQRLMLDRPLKKFAQWRFGLRAGVGRRRGVSGEAVRQRLAKARALVAVSR